VTLRPQPSVAVSLLLAVGTDNPVMVGRRGDAALDSLIFAGGDGLASEVWAAGRHVVTKGRHIARDRITADYVACIKRLQDRL